MLDTKDLQAKCRDRANSSDSGQVSLLKSKTNAMPNLSGAETHLAEGATQLYTSTGPSLEKDWT